MVAPFTPDVNPFPDGADLAECGSAADARAALGWPLDRFVVVHAGPLDPEQDLGTVIEAARLLPDGIDVLIIGESSRCPALQRQSFGLTNLYLLDPLDGARHSLALTSADLLLISQYPDVGAMSLPSLLASYLAAGRTVLAAVSRNSTTAAALSCTPGAGVAVRPGEPNTLAEAIVRLRDALPPVGPSPLARRPALV